ncbi:hypothetical protein ACFWGD_07880 [Corynebacterium sp. NPDC060344]|uniref:hypothetical protein n=1 Tax=Corynebacterium sp. NPDC060344 TaxID=3347101 RepID=UPI00365FCFCE
MSSRMLSVIALAIALTAAAALFFVGSPLPSGWALPLTVAVPAFGAVSLAGAIKARANGLTIAAAFVTFALIPLMYAATLIIAGP